MRKPKEFKHGRCEDGGGRRLQLSTHAADDHRDLEISPSGSAVGCRGRSPRCGQASVDPTGGSVAKAEHPIVCGAPSTNSPWVTIHHSCVTASFPIGEPTPHRQARAATRVPLTARASAGSRTARGTKRPVHEQSARSVTGSGTRAPRNGYRTGNLVHQVSGACCTTLAAVALRALVRPELIQLQGRHP